MIIKSEIPFVVMELAKLSTGMNPFGLRYPRDKRYTIKCLCGHGNSHHDTYYGVVGSYQFELYVNRETHDSHCRLLQPSEYFTV